eukprot:403351839
MASFINSSKNQGSNHSDLNTLQSKINPYPTSNQLRSNSNDQLIGQGSQQSYKNIKSAQTYSNQENKNIYSNNTKTKNKQQKSHQNIKTFQLDTLNADSMQNQDFSMKGFNKSIFTVVNNINSLESKNHQEQKHEYKQIRIQNIIPRVMKSNGGELSLTTSINQGNRFISGDSQQSKVIFKSRTQNNRSGMSNQSHSQIHLDVKFGNQSNHQETPVKRIFTPYQDYYKSSLINNNGQDNKMLIETQTAFFNSTEEENIIRLSSQETYEMKESHQSGMTIDKMNLQDKNIQSLIDSPDLDKLDSSSNESQDRGEGYFGNQYNKRFKDYEGNDQQSAILNVREQEDLKANYYKYGTMKNSTQLPQYLSIINETPGFNVPSSQEIQTDFNNDEYAEYETDDRKSRNNFHQQNQPSNSTIFNHLDKRVDSSANDITNEDIKEIKKNNQFDLDISFLKKIDRLTNSNLDQTKSNFGSFHRTSYNQLNPMIVTVKNNLKEGFGGDQQLNILSIDNNDKDLEEQIEVSGHIDNEIILEEHINYVPEKVSLTKLLNESKEQFYLQAKQENEQKRIAEAQRIASLQMKKISLKKEIQNIRKQVAQNSTLYSTQYKSPSPMRNTQITQKLNLTAQNFFSNNKDKIIHQKQVEYMNKTKNMDDTWKIQLKSVMKNLQTLKPTELQSRPPLANKLKQKKLLQQKAPIQIQQETQKRLELKSLLIDFMSDQKSQKVQGNYHNDHNEHQLTLGSVCQRNSQSTNSKLYYTGQLEKYNNFNRTQNYVDHDYVQEYPHQNTVSKIHIVNQRDRIARTAIGIARLNKPFINYKRDKLSQDSSPREENQRLSLIERSATEVNYVQKNRLMLENVIINRLQSKDQQKRNTISIQDQVQK